MTEPVNLLVMIHGMTPFDTPWDAADKLYEPFWDKLQRSEPGLKLIPFRKKWVQWGHPLPGEEAGSARDDRRLTGAQKNINERTRYANVSAAPRLHNLVLSGRHRDWGIPGVRKMLVRLREKIVLFGMGDVVYYCSGEGETQVRRSVYRQVLGGLTEFEGHGDVRLHLFGHSLGVTLCHDLLYGLFCRREGYEPGFLTGQQAGDDAATEAAFRRWRRKAREGTLKLGSLASAASQLPLFVMRTPALVDRFFQDGTIDPVDIGIVSDDHITWKIFYEVDDILGFATRGLYKEHKGIQDIQVKLGCDPLKAHDEYWDDDEVIRHTAALVYANAL